MEKEMRMKKSRPPAEVRIRWIKNQDIHAANQKFIEVGNKLKRVRIKPRIEIEIRLAGDTSAVGWIASKGSWMDLESVKRTFQITTRLFVQCLKDLPLL